MIDPKVTVTGIKELSAAFKAVDTELPVQLKVAFKEVADHVVGIAQQRMPFQSGKAAGSIKPRSTAKGASIAFGGRAAEYAPWLDFGGSVGRGHQPGVAWSGAIKRDWLGKPNGSGRYVYPAIEESKEYVATEVDKAIKKVAEDAGFDTRETQ